MNALRRFGQVALIAASSLPFVHVAPGIVDAWEARHGQSASSSAVTENAVVPRTPVAHPFAGSSLFGALAEDAQ
ncbi:MAG TPA: hypothetical protein VD931_06840 [Baekduia sp.]|nr:hypothetical protein [Baekduia sp.]